MINKIYIYSLLKIILRTQLKYYVLKHSSSIEEFYQYIISLLNSKKIHNILEYLRSISEFNKYIINKDILIQCTYIIYKILINSDDLWIKLFDKLNEHEVYNHNANTCYNHNF